ncbi:replication protein A 70 kDa DNA-binding subunit A-like [Heracleum sosnowskyi]|uniref:Replication protein A 70 kDa DNA-binding subunit A-like n=1 Tax=Heracleum sosnowskyi TaxID=360622 RepID=A0AAD8IDL2_9APIA|nr:replication protein A 70 kDa DNA-binding subunit A-like [Heracleum sosnowskyi]
MSHEEKRFINRMNIEELLEAEWSEDLKEQIVTVRAVIFGIDNTNNWYYTGCKTCSTKLDFCEGHYRCKPCNEIIDHPLIMFRIQIKVKDKTRDTTFVLFNNIAEPLLDTSANKIVNKLSLDNNDVPKELEGLFGKDIVFKLRLNAYNLK